ncbi:hypothetical protein [Streptomyces rectiverticillatus]|nr:hypothetical protein [Streptomyces rectiverticillatus]
MTSHASPQPAVPEPPAPRHAVRRTVTPADAPSSPLVPYAPPARPGPPAR